MLSKLDFDAKMSKEDYEPLMAELKPRLTLLQQQIIRAKIPVIIIFEGLSAAGKGALINSLILSFDARGFTVYNTRPPEPSELRVPWLTRFVEKLPSYGRLAIFDRAWYSGMFTPHIKLEKEILPRLDEINTFERQLHDDGYLILKYFLHISKKEQKKRFEKLKSTKSTKWRVTKTDMERAKYYDELTAFSDAIIEHTHTSAAPWHAIAATDKRYVRATVFSSVADALEHALTKKQAEKNVEFAPVLSSRFKLIPHEKIEDIKLDQNIEEAEYRALLCEYQSKLFKLQNKLYLNKTPVIIAYEGNDAAGKGGNIKRVASALDARSYAVNPIAAPTPEEINRQYLWRFWRSLPRSGHFAIFDRTWYGRVLVERVEGFTPMSRINQAYEEINEFEYMLHRWGAVIFKFWLAIDKDEQLKRFEDRENTPAKKWKITEEDWRNRDKWDTYTQAVDDMFRLTNTEYAPWTAVESNCKYYARLKTLKTIIDKLD
ncbi:MAG: polyphosphate:AMP phosphotransferase [Christensenella sp.]